MTATVLEHPTALTPPPGVYPQTPMHIYHGWKAASNSRLSRLRRSPAHLKAYLEEPPEDTTALRVGRAIHTAVLEPDDFTAVFTIAEQCGATKKGDGLRCTNAGIAFHSDRGWLCGVHAKGFSPSEFDDSRIVLSPADYAACLGARDSVHAHSSAKGILSGLTHTELSVVWNDPDTGIACKARYDGHSPEIERGVLLDIKSTRDASRYEFERSIFTLGYHRQGALYLDSARAHALPAEHFVIIGVEKEPPYACAAYRLTEGAIDAGRDQLRPLLQRYAECLRTDTWPAYPDEVCDISLPDYAWRQIDQELLEATQ